MYSDKELERLENEQRALRAKQEDRYNTEDSQYEIEDFKNIVNSSIEFAPKRGGKWKDYATEVKIYAKMNAKKNIDTHVNNPYKVWHTHKLPLGCFMCEDTNLISVLVRVINLMASKYPSTTF